MTPIKCTNCPTKDAHCKGMIMGLDLKLKTINVCKDCIKKISMSHTVIKET